jgi:hypothetical protein
MNLTLNDLMSLLEARIRSDADNFAGARVQTGQREA